MMSDPPVQIWSRAKCSGSKAPPCEPIEWTVNQCLRAEPIAATLRHMYTDAIFEYVKENPQGVSPIQIRRKFDVTRHTVSRILKHGEERQMLHKKYYGAGRVLYFYRMRG